jgi:hypothetical protein
MTNIKSKFFTGAAAAASFILVSGTASFGSTGFTTGQTGTVVVDRIVNNTNVYGGDTVNGVTNDTQEGGEFTLITDGGLSSTPSPYVSSGATGTIISDPNVSNENGFQTFCLELGTSYPAGPGGSGSPLPSNSLAYKVSTSIINGNSGGTTAVTLGTAWLYYEFATKSFSSTNFNYNPAYELNAPTVYSARADDSAYLQAAIWFLQGEITESMADGTANPYIALLTAGTGVGGLGLANLGLAEVADPNNIYGVDVMNIGTAGTYEDQAQLVLVAATTTVPDGGSTVMLLGGVLGGLAMFRRKLAALI